MPLVIKSYLKATIPQKAISKKTMV